MNTKMTNIAVIYEHPTKAVYSADSPEYGPIIIKRDRNVLQLKSEYEMLLSLDGKYSCKVYSFKEEEGQLIEERILPGTVLRNEKNLEKRLYAFGKIFHAIHKPQKEGETYLHWLADIKEYCETNQIGGDWTRKAQLAYSICLDIFQKYSERVLLHGDLHHDNILQRGDGSYVMIDPKGVVGPSILDLPRFILNELNTIHEEPLTEHITRVIELISQQFNYPLADVQKSFVMETILGCIWSMQDGEDIDLQDLEIAEYILKNINMEE